MQAYSDAHRLFLQSLISKRFLTDAGIRDAHKRCCELNQDQYNARDFAPFVAAVNAKINTLDMEIRSAHTDRIDGGVMWALVNTNGDEIAQMATEHTADEITFFKKIVELIVNADEEAFELSSIEALGATRYVKTHMAKGVAQKLLDGLVLDGWLQLDAGKYSLSVRTILELQHYLKNEFDESIRECEICKEIVTRFGEQCTLATCDIRLHGHCAKRYFTDTPNRTRNCPKCNTAWAGLMATQAASGRRTKKRRVAAEPEADEDEEVDEREKENRRGPEEDEEEEEEEVHLRRRRT